MKFIVSYFSSPNVIKLETEVNYANLESFLKIVKKDFEKRDDEFKHEIQDVIITVANSGVDEPIIAAFSHYPSSSNTLKDEKIAVLLGLFGDYGRKIQMDGIDHIEERGFEGKVDYKNNAIIASEWFSISERNLDKLMAGSGIDWREDNAGMEDYLNNKLSENFRKTYGKTYGKWLQKNLSEFCTSSFVVGNKISFMTQIVLDVK